MTRRRSGGGPRWACWPANSGPTRRPGGGSPRPRGHGRPRRDGVRRAALAHHARQTVQRLGLGGMTLTSGGPLLTRRRPPGCTGLLDAGTAVEITDSSGTVLGSGTLDTGIAMIDSRSVYGREGYATSCAFSFTVDDDS